MVTNKTIERVFAQSASTDRRIIAFKLSNGVEFIAKYDGCPEAGVMELSSVRLLNIQYDANGTVTASLVPFSNSNPDATVQFSTNEIIAVYTPTYDVEKDYIQSTTKIDLSFAQ